MRDWLVKLIGGLLAVLTLGITLLVKRNRTLTREREHARQQAHIARDEVTLRARVQAKRDEEAARHEVAVAAIVRDAQERAVEAARDASKVAVVADGGDAGARALGELLDDE